MFSRNLISARLHNRLNNRHQTSLLGLITVLSITGLNTSAHADNKWLFSPYLRIDLGYSSTIDDDADASDGGASAFNIIGDQSARYQIGAGLKLNHYLRSDITISYRGDMAETDTFHSLDNGQNYPATKGSYETSNITTMLSIYIDPFAASMIDTGHFSPYLQGGIGWARNRTKFAYLHTISTPITGGKNDDLAWQIGAGFNYALSAHWKIDASYRYISMGEAHGGAEYNNVNIWPRNPRFDLQAHEVMLGLQYQF